MYDEYTVMGAFHDELEKISALAGLSPGAGAVKSVAPKWKPLKTTQKSFGMKNTATQPTPLKSMGLKGVKVPKLNLPGVKAPTKPSVTNERALLGGKLSNITAPV